MNIHTYEEYSSTEKSLTITQMEDIHNCIIKSIQDDQDASELYEDLISASVKYAEIRAEWSLMSREQKMDKDPLRTALHNSVIIQVNMLARYLAQIRRSTSWRNLLGTEEEDRMYRKTIGDFACYIAFVNAICSR
ncbi:MAG: hypothetical protein E7239_12255 [Sarcina sp.]|nr:hypothetical protein [Sarcina sp.]